jgi:acetyl esterase/lipase
VVIFYLHGGGYVTSRPVSYLIFLLKMAESIIAEGLTVSIFALDYRLAPESIFPTQLDDTNYAWRYLTVDMGIDANNVVIMGDSAGGHLALSFLVNLRSPLVSLGESRFGFEEIEQTATKRKGPVTKLLIPGGLVMISPWLSLYSSPASHRQNAYSDVITGSLLIDVAARRLLGPSHPDIASHRYHSQYGYMRTLPHIEFLTPDPAINWKEVLPEWVFVAAGQDEVMIDDIRSWASQMEDEPGSVTVFAGDPEDDRKRRTRVRLEVERGKHHDWQWLETMDEGKKQDFLMTPMGGNSESKFEGIGRIGRMIVDEIRRRKANRAE